MQGAIARLAPVVERWRGQFFDLLFPVRCVGCHRVGDAFCPECRSRARRITAPLCLRCGKPLRAPDEPCFLCREYPLRLDQVRSVAYFEGVVREAILAFKYRRRRELAGALVDFLQEHLARAPLAFDRIAAVPLHPARQRARGYNQSELLARALAARLGRPYAEGLRRVRETADQIGLDTQARRENVRDAFAAEPNAFRGGRVLLVDDVCTTGATLDACAAALRAQGTRAIYGLTVARPQ